MQTLSTKIKKILFGNNAESISDQNGRVKTMTIPATSDDDKNRVIRFAGDDGLILYLIKRIEKLEESVSNKDKLKK